MDESIIENVEILNFEELNNEINGWNDFKNYLEYHSKVIISHKLHIFSCYIRLQNDILNSSLVLSMGKNFE